MSLLFYPISNLKIPKAYAASPGSIVINEIAWMGSADSSADEWIELYNITNTPVDLTNWVIDDDNGSATYTISSGTIPAYGYFLIEDTEEATSAASDAIINISLANTGDSLVLKDETSQTIDTVNSSGGAWYAGNSGSYLSMERIDPLASGDTAGNWADNMLGNGSIGRSSSAINGTPGSGNSVYSGGPTGTNVEFEDLVINPVEGDNFTIHININDATDVLSYGFDILYDPGVIQYISATEGNFLSENGAISTSFNSELENGNPGKIVVGATRLTVPPSGVSGSGLLFDLTFHGLATGSTQLSFDSTSFASDTSGDITVSFDTDTITIDPLTVDPIENFTVTQGVNRYELDLNWNAPATGADSYRILQKDTTDTFIEIGTTANTSFIDADNLVPNNIYEYQVIAVKGSVESQPVNGQSADTRGIKGDNNRSDRVDGRDLENLARHYTLLLSDPNFDPLIDTTYDGIIDGSDLIDIGANWAITY